MLVVCILPTHRRLKESLEVLLIFLLVFNVFLDRHMVEADGRDKVAPRPERSFRQFLGFLLEPSAGFTLDDCHGVGYRVFGRNGKIDVDMLVSDVPGEDFKTFLFADHFEYSLEFCFNVGIFQYFASVLGSPDEMILADVCAVAKVIDSCVSHK